MIEFALTAGLTMLVIVGGIVLSIMMNDSGTLNDAARAGARTASIEYNHSAQWNSDGYSAAYSLLQAQGLNMSDLQSISVQPTAGPNGQQMVRVDVTYNYHITTEIVRVVLGNYRTLHGYAEFPVEP